MLKPWVRTASRLTGAGFLVALAGCLFYLAYKSFSVAKAAQLLANPRSAEEDLWMWAILILGSVCFFLGSGSLGMALLLNRKYLPFLNWLFELAEDEKEEEPAIPLEEADKAEYVFRKFRAGAL